jgi:ATP-binding cassette subfamily B protein
VAVLEGNVVASTRSCSWRGSGQALSAGCGARRIVPETIQTSGMDCGPASLRSLMAGFGMQVSYGGLREACRTDVDGHLDRRARGTATGWASTARS